MQLVRLFVPFLNEIADISYFPEFENLKPGDNILVKYREKDDFDEILDAKIVALIDTGKIETEINENIIFSKKCSNEDNQKLVSLESKVADYLKVFNEESRNLLVDLIPVSSMTSFTEKTVLFTYTAEERVDFRELLKSLAAKLKKRIQLRHIGGRDRASAVGGFGVCGREICCSKFLRNIPSVKIDVVRDQEFFHKDPESISGLCGKLKCCLNYEVEQYREMKKGMPKVGKKIFINGREGKIIGLDIFNQKVKIRFESGAEIVSVSDLPKG